MIYNRVSVEILVLFLRPKKLGHLERIFGLGHLELFRGLGPLDRIGLGPREVIGLVGFN